MKLEDGKAPKFTEDDKIIQEAKERFDRCVDWESMARERFLEDIRFANGDSDNGYQWPNDTRKNRDAEKRPVLTVNKTRQYNLNIINDGKQNKPTVKIRPAGKEASFDGAQVMEGLVRYIEYKSNAQAIYDKASEFQVQGGVGYWRVTTEYADNESFDQDIVIKKIKDPLMVYIDPDANEPDKRDMRFAFVFDDMARDRFNAEYPHLINMIGTSPVAMGTDWIDKDHVKVCEYYRVSMYKDKLYLITNPETGEAKTLPGKGVSKEIIKALMEDPTTKVRDIEVKKVEWFKIAGDQIIDKKIWAGTTIPIVQVLGEETIIEGKLDRKGHTRALKDPQRIYNYWTSSAVEFVALQSKSPFVGAAQAIEGYETYWRTANTVNHSILPYNHVDDNGTEIPPPQRQAPPTMAPAYLQGMQIAAEEMRMASGQYQEDMGEQSNAISGKAITARQRQGDNATYHFIDNLGIAIRYTGAIIIELIPKIYDTARIVKILSEDGTPTDIRIDPNAAQEIAQQQQATLDKVSLIFNPNFAKYSVEADIGPAYATKRQEAFTAFTQIIAQSPQLMQVAGDLMFQAADFPMADELAKRLKKMVPPFVLGQAPDPQTLQLIQQNQSLMESVKTLMQQYAEERAKRELDKRDVQIDAYKAETDRLKAFGENMNPNVIASLTAQLVLQMLQTPMPPQNLSSMVPAPIPKDAATPAAPEGGIGPGMTPPGGMQ